MENCLFKLDHGEGVLREGVVRLAVLTLVARKDGQDFFLAVGEGFAEITGDPVVILTDMAIQSGDIDERKAEDACQRAETRLRERLTGEEEAVTRAALAHSVAQIKVKRCR